MENKGIYIERNLEKRINKYIASPEILAIIGPRQAGKTTLISKIYRNLKEAIFITFEDIETLSMFESDIKTFIKIYIKPFKYIFIDEFQYSKSGGKHLKFIYDTIKEKKIVISGSSCIDLTIKTISFLTGRVLVFELYPLSFEEFLSYKDPSVCKIFKDINTSISNLEELKKVPEISSAVNKRIMRYLGEYIIYGGFPRIVIENDFKEKEFLLKNIVNTYLLKDFREASGFLDDIVTLKLIKALALQVGNLVEYNELSLLTTSSFKTIKKSLSLFEKTFILKMVSPFYTNKRSELVKNPKVYFIDTGLRNSIINDFKPMDSRVDIGAILENFVFSQINQREDVMKYWRSKGGNEVDFILEKGNCIIPIEIKSRITSLSIPRSLVFFFKRYSPLKAFILNSRYFGKRSIDKSEVFFLPLWII